MLFPDESVITLTKICNIGSMPENVLAGKLNTISLYLVILRVELSVKFEIKYNS